MSNLSDFIGSGGGLKPFQDLGTVTGTVDLDVSTYGSFRVVQGDGDITFNVIGASANTAGHAELFFYRNYDWSVDFGNLDLVGNGYIDIPQIIVELSYDNVSFSVSSQDTTPISITFNNDGSKMYMVGNTNDSVYQYTLTTPFDLSTASYDTVSFSVSSQDTDPRGITFNNDGSKMYMVGATNDSVYQYTLTTPFDLSTASYDNVSFSVTAQDTTPRGITFNNDGSKIYMVGYTNDSVYQYTLNPSALQTTHIHGNYKAVVVETTI